ncbi:MAG: ABC transporter permease [Rhodothermales bacterium]
MLDFDLDAAIAAWRQAYARRDVFSLDDLDELEYHLRDHFAALSEAGHAPADAFAEAQHHIGDGLHTALEYDKVRWGKAYRERRLLPLLTSESVMLKNYLLIAFRVFWKRKGYVALNAVGLALGMAASLLILQHVQTERSYDAFHEHSDDIYRVQYNAYKDGRFEFASAVSYPMIGPAMQSDFPEVEAYVRLFPYYGGAVITQGDRSFKEADVFQADSTFFDLFSYPLLVGEATKVLNRPNTAVLSATTAHKYFGNANPIGERISVAGRREYEVTGVAESPETSHLKFDVLLSYQTLVNDWGEDLNTAWGWYDFYNYIRVRPGTDPTALEARMPDFITTHGGENAVDAVEFLLQPLRSLHLESDLMYEMQANGSATAVQFLSIIALFILGIAWVNYINLSTARATERAREIGVRKVLGAAKGQLIRQFLMESVLMNALAAVLAIGLMLVLLPVFSGLVGGNVSYGFFRQTWFWLTFSGLFMVGSLLAGVYPAFVLSAYRPVQVLKGAFSRSTSGLLLRRTLVVAQFAISFALIAGTLVVFEQLSFMRQHDLGIDTEHLLVVEGPSVIANDSLFTDEQRTFKEALIQQAAIHSVAASNSIPGNIIYWTSEARNPATDARTVIYQMGVDYDYLGVYGHNLLAGRTFDRDFGTDETALIINETMRQRLGFASPQAALSQSVTRGSDTLQVIGVVADYHQVGLKQAYEPTGFLLRPNARSYYTLRVQSADLAATVAYVGQQYEAFFPNNPYTQYFLDAHFNQQYEREQQFGQAFSFFALLAIVVACLGLFGLSLFTVTQRTKEIGVRKVMGATLGQVVVLLVHDVIKLVVLGSLLAAPIIWVTMQGWLEGFAFHVDLGVLVFLSAALLTLILALATVSYQSVRAARSNPIDALRYE